MKCCCIATMAVSVVGCVIVAISMRRSGAAIIAPILFALIFAAIAVRLCNPRQRARRAVLPVHAPQQRQATNLTPRQTTAPKTEPRRTESDSNHTAKMTVDCLMCRSAPKDGKHDFCGIICKDIAMGCTPLLLPIPVGHVTFKIVENKFRSAWKDPQGRACPQIKRIFRIIESETSRQLYKTYRDQHGNEVFRYHGTGRECSIGTTEDNQYPCMSTTCRACNIIRTSFQVDRSRDARTLSLGRGIYTTSAANKASTFCHGSGVMFVTKVVLGVVWHVYQHRAVNCCPVGYNSVVFDKQNGQLNETVVYQDDAIRPIYLIVFG